MQGDGHAQPLSTFASRLGPDGRGSTHLDAVWPESREAVYTQLCDRTPEKGVTLLLPLVCAGNGEKRKPKLIKPVGLP